MEQINVDLIPGKVLQVCHASQYDIGRTIRINLFEGGQVYTFDGTQAAQLKVRKTDGNVVTEALTATMGNSYVEIETTQQMTACAGFNMCDIVIIDSSNSISTANFIMSVEADPLDGGINSQSEIHDLQSQVNAAVGNSLSDITGFRPYGIPPYMMSLFKPLTNLFSNFDNFISGAYYTAQTPIAVGKHINITTTANWKGWLVRVKPNTTYTFGPVDFRVLFYDPQLNVDKVVDQSTLSDTNPNTVTSGATSYWMAITERIARDMSAWMMVEGNAYPDSYVSGLPQWVEMPKISDDKMTKMAISYTSTPITVAYGENSATITIPSGRVLTEDGAVAAPSGTLTTAAANWISYDKTMDAWRLTQHVEGHEVYTIGWINPANTKAVLMANFVESGTPEGKAFRVWGMVYCAGNYTPKLKYTSTGATLTMPQCRIVYEDNNFVCPATTINFTASNWLCYDVDAQELRTGWSVTGHTLIMLGVISTAKYENSFISGTTISVNKTIAFFGDSIAAGVGTSKVFHQYIGERYGFTCLNYGYGGSGYVQNYESYGSGRLGTGAEGMGVPITADNYFVPNNVLTRLAEPNPADLDGVVIFAGTNDWSHAGTITLQDFIDGVEAVFNYFQTNFGNVPLLVMLPIHRKNDTVPNAAGKTLREYCDILIDECKKFGVPYVDTMTFSGLHPDNAGNDAAFFPRDDRTPPSSDGLHPNHIAHQRIERVVGEVLNALVKYSDTSMR